MAFAQEGGIQGTHIFRCLLPKSKIKKKKKKNQFTIDVFGVEAEISDVYLQTQYPELSAWLNTTFGERSLFFKH